MTRWKRAALFTATAIGVGVAGATPAGAQDLRKDRNGGWSVHYPGPCNVFYNPNGIRITANRACTRSQIRIADDLVRNRRYDDPRYDNRGYRGTRYGNQEPRVRIYRNGSGYLLYPNGCRIQFNAIGNQVAGTPQCNRDQRRYADVVYRQHLYGGPRRSTRYGTNFARPFADNYGGLIRVRLSGLDCTYLYTREGNHIRTVGRDCNSRLRQISNDEARRYQRAMGW